VIRIAVSEVKIVSQKQSSLPEISAHKLTNWVPE